MENYITGEPATRGKNHCRITNLTEKNLLYQRKGRIIDQINKYSAENIAESRKFWFSKLLLNSRKWSSFMQNWG